MATRTDITAAQLRAILHYDPETGIFTWLQRPLRMVDARADKSWNTRWAGKQAGTMSHGYVSIRIKQKPYHAHRLAYLYMTGRWPVDHIDHNDVDRSNNRWSNLRDATKSQNAANTSIRSDNTSGFKGVSWDKKAKKFTAYITKNGKRMFLGYFDNPKDAHIKYCLEAKLKFNEYARAS